VAIGARCLHYSPLEFTSLVWRCGVTGSVSWDAAWDAAPVVVQDDALKGHHTLASRPIHAGEVIASLERCRQVAEPDRYTVQAGIDVHLDELGPFTYLNHSCAPNVILDMVALVIIARADIAAGEELSFFYPSTEWRMAEPFACHCGSPDCIGTVSGAAELSDEVLSRYFVNPHIRALRQLT
jgi:hypothetical protein